jgi:acyl dehydratase
VPNIVTVESWERCDHSGPVHEGDMLSSEVEVTGRAPLPGGGGVVHLRSTVTARDDRPVLDWRFAVLLA